MAEVRRLLATKGAPGVARAARAGLRRDALQERARLLLQPRAGSCTSSRRRGARGPPEAAKETTAAQEAHAAKVGEWEAKETQSRGKRPAKPKAVTTSAAEKAATAMTPDEAVWQKLEAMHDAGQIPEWAWHKIVRLTELRIWYADTGWEDAAAEKPTGTPQDALWIKALDDWTGKQKVGAMGYGITGWRREIDRRNVLVTTRMVCNELSEATQRSRGVSLDGGISKNARQYVGAGTPGAYFKRPASLDDFKPGAALFWINDSEWEARSPTTPTRSTGSRA